MRADRQTDRHAHCNTSHPDRERISMFWGNTAYCVKLSGEYVLRYSNKFKSVDKENVRIMTIVLRK